MIAIFNFLVGGRNPAFKKHMKWYCFEDDDQNPYGSIGFWKWWSESLWIYMVLKIMIRIPLWKLMLLVHPDRTHYVFTLFLGSHCKYYSIMVDITPVIGQAIAGHDSEWSEVVAVFVNKWAQKFAASRFSWGAPFQSRQSELEYFLGPGKCWSEWVMRNVRKPTLHDWQRHASVSP